MMENEELMYLLQDRESTKEDGEVCLSAMLSDEITRFLEDDFTREHKLYSGDDSMLVFMAERRLKELPDGKMYKVKAVETYHDFATYKRVVRVQVEKNHFLARGKRGLAGAMLFDTLGADRLRPPMYYNLNDWETEYYGRFIEEEQDGIAEIYDRFIAQHYQMPEGLPPMAPEPIPTRDVGTFTVRERFGAGIINDTPTVAPYIRFGDMEVNN